MADEGYQYADVPGGGERIIVAADGTLTVPDRPIIPFIEGDGIGPDIWRATRRVLEAAIRRAYEGEREIVWMEVLAGGKAHEQAGEWLPEETFRALREFKVGIKGPLTTPVGGGIRSLNVTLRKELDLYSCIRPVRYIPGVPSPLRKPEDVNLVVFRENTEDVYAGIEWPAGSDEVRKLRGFLVQSMGAQVREGSGIGVKPISQFGTKRLVAAAIQHAIDRGLPSVTLVHKGNIMKFTEGAFREWGYEVARERFGDQTVPENELEGDEGAAGRVVVKDRIADAMFQQMLLRPAEYSVLATPNLNGDYLSDAAAAMVGGLGMAPGGNVGDEVALFEATHGTAPKYTGMDKVNPGSLILSAVMMLEHLGWNEAADRVRHGMETAIGEKIVTYDLARQLEGATKVPTSGFADAVIERM